MTRPKAVVFGCRGPDLAPDEFTFFSETRPIGFILFSRNCISPRQIRTLTRDLRKSIDDDNAPILIDQEGGRVVRLRKPYWREPPAAQIFSDLAENDIDLACEALNLNIRLIGADLRALGITVNCLPVLDIRTSDADPIISDRALGVDAKIISILGRVACDSLF